MSATGRPNQKGPKTERIQNDAYITPKECAEAIVLAIAEDPLLNYERGKRIDVLEPSAGDGAFVRAALNVFAHAQVDSIEIRKECKSKLLAAGSNTIKIDDFRTVNLPKRYDLVIGNPPYNQAEEHIVKAMDEALISPHAVVAFLLRLGFLSSKKRKTFSALRPPSLILQLQERPSFTGGGTDGSEYACFVWHKVPRQPTIHRMLSWC